MRHLVLAALLAAAVPVSATPPIMPPTPGPPPRLLIVISVDQLSADLFDEYRPHFTGGFARLAKGTVFRNGYQAHAATETCPGHSTILTGSAPAQTGIVANSWIDQSVGRSDKSIYCAEDERVPGSSSSDYQVSPVHLRSQTLGDLMKNAVPSTRNIAVAGKDRAAVMMGGHSADQRWYWDGKRFATDRKGALAPKTVAALNPAFAQSLAPAQPPLDAPALCQAKSHPFPLSDKLTVGTGRLDRVAGDARGVRATPAFDAAVLAIAAGLTEEMRLGRGEATTDILSVGLSATDYVGHSFGNGGPEMCLQLLALDRELADFFAVMDRTNVDYAVVLTADHGGMDIPERLRLRGIAAAARANEALTPSAVGKRIVAELKLRGPVLLGESIGGDIWLDRALSPADRRRAMDRALAIYSSDAQVAAVFTAETLARTPLPSGAPDKWSLQQRARASFDPARSGDFVVLLKQYVSPIAKPSSGYVATHGTPWDYDRRVPIIFWRRGMAAADRSDAVSTVDIMPTLAAMIGIRPDSAAIAGHCIAGIPGVVCPPR